MNELLEFHTRRIRGDEHRRGMGWRRSLPDRRDHIADTSEIKVLAEVDPRKQMPPIYDQLRKGSCTAHGVKRVGEYDRIIRGKDLLDVSREAMYYFERMLEGQPLDQDTGAEGRDGFKAWQTIGLPTEKEWPYSDSTDSSEWPEWGEDPRFRLPSADFVKLEGTYKAVPQTLQAIKAVLSNQQMIALGASLYESFESPEVEKTGIVPMPQQSEQIIGGHEFVIIGYLKDMPNDALCANSWGSKGTDGTEWGIDAEGCFFFPWQMVLDAQISGDLRTVPHPVPSGIH